MKTLDYSFERRLELASEEARKDGIAEGEQIGLALVFSVLTRLKSGASAESLIAEGIPADIVNQAAEILK